MEELANSMQQNHTPYIGRTEVNGLEFENVHIKEDNCVYFVDSERSRAAGAGWIYTANCTPSPDQFRRYELVADNWYAYG